MNNLVFIQNRRPVTDTLTVADVFGKNHADVLRDVRNVLSTVDTEWGISNFAETPYTHQQNNQTYLKYVMTEDGFTLLAMGYTGKDAMRFKVEYIKEFRRMKEQLANGTNHPRELTRLELIELARESELARLEAERKNADLQHRLQIQEPKVALYDVAMSADNAQPIGTVAKTLDVGPNKLFAFLRAKKVLISYGSRYNQPYQEYIDRGYFAVRQYTITHFTTGVENKTQTMVTPKGLAFIHRLLTQEKALAKTV